MPSKQKSPRNEARRPVWAEVSLGALIDGMRVVKSGVFPGDLVVVDGLQRVRPGQPVTPEKVSIDDRGMPITKPAGQQGGQS